MKIGILQQNYTVGDFEGNGAKIAQGACELADQQADLVVTSELALIGYPPRDLLLQSGFISKSWLVLEGLARRLKEGPALLVGLAEPNDQKDGRPLFNSAVFLHQGKILQRFRKSLLPTYDVFDEDRYFEPSSAPQILDFQGERLGITICEDLWNDGDFWGHRRYHQNPMDKLQTATCVINLSASPFALGKQKVRTAMLGQLAQKYAKPIVYVNQVGGQDDLIFDGRSCAFDAGGKLLVQARAFKEDGLVFDLDRPSQDFQAPLFSEPEEIWKALVLGTRDYGRKCGFKKALLGLSGGIDSSLVAAVATSALGAQNILGVMMPSPYSSQGSIDDSEKLAKNLAIQTMTIPIEPMMKSFDHALSQAFYGTRPGVAEENLQARIRGNLLMAISNKFCSLLLTTGNKSEIAVGYCTLYGDMSGGLAVIADLAKTTVYRLCEWLNQKGEIIPSSVLTKPPSAELRPDQTDQDSLPPYEILDGILNLYVEQYLSRQEIIDKGYSAETVAQVLGLVKRAEFKRKQTPPGLKITPRAFGTGWRMPLASKDWDGQTQ